jgi:hypothetical protein
MSTTTMNDMPQSATAAVAEATRIAADAARTNTQNAKASIEAARSYFDEANGLGRDLLNTWSTQSEEVLRTAFGAQNAAIDAGLSLFDLSVKSNKQAVAQFSDLLKRTQQATLETWQSTIKATAKATEPTKR